MVVFLIGGCSVDFTVISDDLSYNIGITGYDIPNTSTEFSFYGEGCACFNSLSKNVHVDSVFVNLTLVNSTSHTMNFELLISNAGLTDCGEDTVYYEYRSFGTYISNKPSYIDSAEVIFDGDIQPGDTITIKRASPALREGVEEGRVWVIVKNSSTIGISDYSLSAEIGITFSVEVKGRLDTSPLEGLERMVF